MLFRSLGNVLFKSLYLNCVLLVIENRRYVIFHWRMILKMGPMGFYIWKGINIGRTKIHNGGNYAHAHVLNAFNFCLSSNSINLSF